MAKHIYLFNIDGAIQEIYTEGDDFDTILFKIKDVDKPIPVKLEEVMSLINDLKEVVYTINATIQQEMMNSSIKIGEVLEDLLEKKEEKDV